MADQNATTNNVLGTVAGAIIGGTVLVAVAPVLLPIVGAGALVAAITPGVGALIGGWLGHTVTKPSA